MRRGECVDERFRSANLQIDYPGKHRAALLQGMRPFVLLEIGSARVTPYVTRDLTSFIHEHLEGTGQLTAFTDNRPRSLRCVHPVVTLLEKLDALTRRFLHPQAAPATFVRHFEDAARIARARSALPSFPGHPTVRALADDLVAQRQIATLPSSMHAAFNPSEHDRWRAVQKAHAAIAPMFWGSRLSLEEASTDIRCWIDAEFGR